MLLEDSKGRIKDDGMTIKLAPNHGLDLLVQQIYTKTFIYSNI
jgi:hypothetical protein